MKTPARIKRLVGATLHSCGRFVGALTLTIRVSLRPSVFAKCLQRHSPFDGKHPWTGCEGRTGRPTSRGREPVNTPEPRTGGNTG